MGKVSEQLPPFLAKIILLTQNTDDSISGWNEEGKIYIVKDENRFNQILKKYFKGTAQTFIRQLHFYGFRKVDVHQKIGVWGFEHENGLFVKDKTDLVKDIRRKTKVDPDTQKLASYYEVQALKSQVSFLQQIIEDLRVQINSLKLSKSKSVKSGNLGATQIPTRKRQRTKKTTANNKCSLSSMSTLEEMCASFPDANISKESENNLGGVPKLKFETLGVDVIDSTFGRTPSFDSLPSLQSTLDIEMDSFSDLFSDMELDQHTNAVFNINDNSSGNAPANASDLFSKTLLEKESGNLGNAVKLISEATKVKEADVSKIITFLSKLSVEAAEENQDLAHQKDEFGHYAFPGLDKIVAPRIQKVGAS